MDELKLIIPIFFSLVGWVVAHRFTSHRDLENKKRETKINLIIKSYENIALWMSEPIGGEALKELANALILVQCFGSQYQIKKAQEAMKSIVEEDDYVVGLGDLLTSLRNDFRNELNLPDEKSTVSTIHFRRSKVGLPLGSPP